MAFNMTIPGIPTIYYGDEYGMPGANDPDNRRQLQFEKLNDLESNTFEITKKLVQLRRSNIQLLLGDLEVLFVDDNILVYTRSYFDKTGIVVFNKSAKPEVVHLKLDYRFKNLNLKANFGSKFNLADGSLEVLMEAYAFEILTN
jgi:glycosidase